MPERTCPYCGDSVKRGPQAVYCSAACKDRASNRRAIADGRYTEWKAGKAARRAAAAAANRKPCPYCGAMMTNLRRVQCGAPDCERRFNNERSAEFQRQYKERTGTHYQYRFKPHRKLCESCGQPFGSREEQIRFCSVACANKGRRWALTCEVCGTQWSAGRADARYCSPRCLRTARRAPGRQLALYEEPRRRPIAVLPPLRRRWYAGQCRWCGDWFIHDQPHTNTCTLRCAKRLGASRAKLRRRMHGREPGQVQRWRVFERDGWICRLCGEPTERGQAVPHPAAPTIDHIIPLAAWPEFNGAVHEDANLQCAHYRCNVRKGAALAAI